MKCIGRYEGKDCYQCTHQEWLKDENRESNDIIFIIDERMVHGNKIIGNYDGHRVEKFERPYDTYYAERGYKEEVRPASEPMDFSEYSSVVDEFFRKHTMETASN